MTPDSKGRRERLARELAFSIGAEGASRHKIEKDFTSILASHGVGEERCTCGPPQAAYDDHESSCPRYLHPLPSHGVFAEMGEPVLWITEDELERVRATWRNGLRWNTAVIHAQDGKLSADAPPRIALYRAETEGREG